MIFWIVRRYYGTKGQEFNGMGKGITILSFFHSKASQRKKKNTITGLRDENGNWCVTSESIATVAISYFEKLHTTSHPSQISKVTDTIPTKVIDEMNQSLTQTFTRSEVEAALK